MAQLDLEFNTPYIIDDNRTGSFGTAASLSFSPFLVHDKIFLNNVIMFALNGGGAVGSATFHLGLYSLNVSTLSLANSLLLNLTHSTGTNVLLQFTATSSTQNVTPGVWYFGLLCRSQGAANIFDIYGRSSNVGGQGAFLGGFFGGNMTASTSALPATIATSALTTTGGAALFVPSIIIAA